MKSQVTVSTLIDILRNRRALLTLRMLNGAEGGQINTWYNELGQIAHHLKDCIFPMVVEGVWEFDSIILPCTQTIGLPEQMDVIKTAGDMCKECGYPLYLHGPARSQMSAEEQQYLVAIKAYDTKLEELL